MNCLSVAILDGPRNNVGSQDQDSQGKEYRNTPFFTPPLPDLSSFI